LDRFKTFNLPSALTIEKNQNMAATLNTESNFILQNNENLNLPVAIQDQNTSVDPNRQQVLNFLLNTLNEHTDAL